MSDLVGNTNSWFCQAKTHFLVFVVTLTKQRVIFVLFTQYIKSNMAKLRQRNDLSIKYSYMSEHSISKSGLGNVCDCYNRQT